MARAKIPGRDDRGRARCPDCKGSCSEQVTVKKTRKVKKTRIVKKNDANGKMIEVVQPYTEVEHYTETKRQTCSHCGGKGVITR